jgi:hypothetical protein
LLGFNFFYCHQYHQVILTKILSKHDKLLKVHTVCDIDGNFEKLKPSNIKMP